MAAPPTGPIACPVYPWPSDGAAQGRKKLFMQSDCAACHSALPYAGLREATASADVRAQEANIVIAAAAEVAQPQPRHLHGGPPPDLAALVTRIQGSTGGEVAKTTMMAGGTAVCEELKKKITAPLSPVWLHYTRTFQAA
ncbi:uncharacterized protein LOC100825515 [Brachypodium distachyon]|nr:uncharacterized protein LOC100825515 [Brachypodium distachyon]|eukprot:XP_003570375.3 uncharacterized protein LOC100825515 [Brachypodium distachyon]